MVHRPSTRERRIFTTNYENAKAAGVVYDTAEIVYHAILRGATSLTFNNSWGVVAVDDDYVGYINDELFNTAVRQNLHNAVKWVE